MVDLGDLSHLKGLMGTELKEALIEIFEKVYPNQDQLKYVEFEHMMYKANESRLGEISPLALETIINSINSTYAMFLFGCNLHEYL